MTTNSSIQGSSSRSESTQRKKEIVSDFSAPEYWSNRFEKEKSFEWLADTRAIGPIVLELVKEISQAQSLPSHHSTHPKSTSLSNVEEGFSGPIVNILHFGCGTSYLGPDLSTLLRSNGYNAKVVDADYVSGSITSNNTLKEGDGSRNGVPLINLNVLDPDELEASKPNGGWDLLLDKSTADAISCGKGMIRRIVKESASEMKEEEEIKGSEEGAEKAENDTFVDAEGEYELVEPIQILCDNLAAVTRVGGKWICISYSSSRFDHLKATPNSSSADTTMTAVRADKPAWRLISATPVDGAYTAPSTVNDGGGGKRVVYAPETNVWGYILERT